MAKRDVHLKFTIGNKFVTVEGGSGYIADAQDPMFDTVNVVIRGKNASGGVGPIEDRSLYIQRDQILAIGLNFLGRCGPGAALLGARTRNPQSTTWWKRTAESWRRTATRISSSGMPMFAASTRTCAGGSTPCSAASGCSKPFQSLRRNSSTCCWPSSKAPVPYRLVSSLSRSRLRRSPH